MPKTTTATEAQQREYARLLEEGQELAQVASMSFLAALEMLAAAHKAKPGKRTKKSK